MRHRQSKTSDQRKTGSSRHHRPAPRPLSIPQPQSEPKTAQSKTTNLPRSSRRDCSRFSADRIKETNPNHINLLWGRVMAQPNKHGFLRPTVSSQQKRQSSQQESQPSQQNNRLKNGSSPLYSDSTSLEYSDTADFDMRSMTSMTSVSRKSTRNATVRDPDFEQTQLVPRGINIHRSPDLSLNAVGGAYTHFGSQAPPDAAQSQEFYRSVVKNSLTGKVERDIDGSIFLSMSPDFVRSVHISYRSLQEAELPEPEYRGYAFQTLFIGQYSLISNDSSRQLCAVRALEWSIKPSTFRGQPWLSPALLSPNNPPLRPFGFDIYPDCQFWLNCKMLNPDYRANLHDVVHCKALGAFCPYFTIEFKAKSDDSRTVENQVAAAGAVSLFNRCDLKLRACPQPAPIQLTKVRHYGVTMEKDSWTVWLFTPTMADGAWSGCKMQYLSSGDCKSETGVRGLLSWINEIHRWGLCEYALDCEDDIKRYLNMATGLRVSAMGP